MVARAALGARMTQKKLLWASALLLCAALVFAAEQRRGETWRELQARYLAEIPDGEEETIRPHEIRVPPLAIVDRCTTCHLGHEPGAQTLDDPPFRGHPRSDVDDAMHRQHPTGRFACTTCHGGQGRALEKSLAHDRRHQSGGWSAFTEPRARCARCHPQGGQRSKRGQRGAEVYFEQGCSGCHQPGREGPGVGPDLSSIGLRGRDYLERVLLRPDEVYPQTIMPPLRFVLDEDGADLEALLTLLQSFEPWPRLEPRHARRFNPSECTSCHRVDERPMPVGGRPHRCSYLQNEASWLRCDRCHGTLPQGEAPPPPQALQNREAPEVAAQPEGDSPTESPEAAPTGETTEGEPPTPPPFPRPARPDPETPTIDDATGSCPFLESAFSSCGVCHREGER